jgi:hypothetical protein
MESEVSDCRGVKQRSGGQSQDWGLYTQNPTLVEALVGRKCKVPLIDGTVLPMHLTDIAAPVYPICISGEGVSIWDAIDSSALRKRDLFVEFNVEWPLNAEQF